MNEFVSRAREWMQHLSRDVEILNAFGDMEGVTISIDQKVPNAVSLHYQPDSELSDSVRWKLFNDALIHLERVVQRFEHVTHIYATTWIAQKNPGFFERYGFTVTHPQIGNDGTHSFSSEPYISLNAIYMDEAKKFGIREEHKNIPPAVAEYSREKFLDPQAPWRRLANRTKK